MKYKMHIGLILLSLDCRPWGCTGGKPMTLENYTKELAATDPAKTAPVKPGSAEEKAGIENFKDYYRIVTPRTSSGATRRSSTRKRPSSRAATRK